MIYCPFCDGQGVINKAIIKKNKSVIYICDECDTVWKDLTLSEDDCERFDVLMEQLRLKPLWSELESVEEI